MEDLTALIGSTVAMYLVSYLLVGGIIGYFIGKSKNRTSAGFWFGFFLGIIGWVIVLVGPDLNVKCPQCKGNVVKGAAKCKNCGSDLELKI